MDKRIEESIHNFEFKKGFREVKLKTRQSFREDQAALDRRLSKPKIENGMSNGVTNGHAEKCVAAETDKNVLSKLESIVLDINVENEQERKQSTDEVIVIGTEEKRSRKNSLDNNVVLDESMGNVRENSGNKTVSESMQAKTRIPPVPLQNGHIVQQVNQNRSSLGNGLVPNGHVVLHNGQTSGPPTLLIRPTVNGQVRTAMTPEPRLKSLKGIYQKNPKLTAASTEHLDNISLKGFKTSGHTHTHGQRAEHQHVVVPTVPGAEVTSIPADGNLSEFNVEQMITVFRLLRLPEDLVYRFSKCNVDGKRFAVFTDSEMKDLGMNNPIIKYFRDRTAKTHKKKRSKFML